jgi:curved DNA-binding protein CbpA
LDELAAAGEYEASSAAEADALKTAYSVLSDPDTRVKYDLARLLRQKCRSR